MIKFKKVRTYSFEIDQETDEHFEEGCQHEANEAVDGLLAGIEVADVSTTVRLGLRCHGSATAIQALGSDLQNDHEGKQAHDNAQVENYRTVLIAILVELVVKGLTTVSNVLPVNQPLVEGDKREAEDFRHLSKHD